MTSPRYWTDPLSGVDYSSGQQLKSVHMNAYRDSCIKLDSAVERMISQSWSFDGFTPAQSASVACYEPLSRQWYLMGEVAGTPYGYYGPSPQGIAAASTTAGDGLVPNEMASTTRASTLSKMVVACGTPGSSSNKKYRYLNATGDAFPVATSSATSTAGINTICWHIDRFVSGGDGGFVEYSTTGTSFSAATPANANNVDCLRSNGSLVVGISKSSTNKIIKSVDGVNWTESTLPSTVSPDGLVWVPGASKWVINAGVNWQVLWSSDAITWTPYSIVYPVYFQIILDSAVCTGNRIVAIYSTEIVISDDLGLNWRSIFKKGTGSSLTMKSVAAGLDENGVVGQLVIPAGTGPLVYSPSLL